MADHCLIPNSLYFVVDGVDFNKSGARLTSLGDLQGLMS